ncbi:kinase-like protein [Acephala macrosclerotiorum]|nr:kinase-like protein [Acephala macrosclerotiorum]
MSTYEVLPEVRRKQPVGTFEPSTELLNKLRGLLISSPPTTRSNSVKSYPRLPFQPDQRRPSIKQEDSSFELSYPSTSSIPQSEPLDILPEPKPIRAVKIYRSNTPRSHKHSPRHSRTHRPGTSSLPHLIHPNVLDPYDNVPDERSGYAITFTSLLSLEHLIHRSKRMSASEADSYFKQSILGLEYLHRSGVAHQDIRPENLLITINGVLKIANFQRADYFGFGGKNGVVARRKNSSISSDYIAPEVFIRTEYDPRSVDMWAIGLVYMEMRRGKLLWSVAAEGADESYDRYLQEKVGMWGYRPIENLSDEHCRRVISSLLDPVPERRYSAARVLKSTWCNSMELGSSITNETP